MHIVFAAESQSLHSFPVFPKLSVLFLLHGMMLAMNNVHDAVCGCNIYRWEHAHFLHFVDDDFSLAVEANILPRNAHRRYCRIRDFFQQLFAGFGAVSVEG